MERRTFLKSAGMAAAGMAAAGQQTGRTEQKEYPLGADSKRQPGVPAGEQFSFEMASSRIYPGTRRRIDVYVPAAYDGTRPACVWVSLDGLLGSLPAVLDNLIHNKELPVMIAVGLHPGEVASAEPPRNPRFNRSFEFDSLTDVLGRFILEELLPAVEQRKTGTGLAIRLSTDPNDRGITGASSGGIGAFTAAWQRPEAFRRVYAMIGTYVGMRGGDRYPVLVRKTEPKPLRIFLQDNDGDGWPGGLELGDWWMSNQAMERALTFAGYAVNHSWDTGVHETRQGESTLPEVMRWLWKEWPRPIAAGETENFAVGAIAEPGAGWELVLGESAESVRTGLALYGGAGVGEKTAVALASDAQGRVYCLNPANGTITRLGESGRFAKVAAGDHGMAFGPDGRLYVAEAARSRILAIDAAGKTAVVAEGVRAQRLTVTHAGIIYAADGDAGRVWVLRPREKPAVAAEGLDGPAGIALTPDGLWLAVANARGHHAVSYRVQADGALDLGEPLYWFHVPAAANDCGAGELAFDRQGWMLGATRMGVQVFDRNGRVTAIFPVGRAELAGLCFGGTGRDVLYVSTGSAVYRRRVKVRGAMSWEAPVELGPWGAA